MTNLETISESFQGLLAQACLSALLAIVGVAAAAKILKKIRVAFSSLWRKSRFSFAAVMLLSLTMFLWADKTNLLRMIIHPGGPLVATVSEADILRGFRLEGIATNETPFCEMPSNAVEYAPWRLRGGRETDFPLKLGDFVFPYGTNTINRFRVLSGGTIETYPKLNAPVAICAAREYSSLIPGVSRFWSADANGGAEKVLRWDSVFANRDHTGGYSAEIRLSANGDFSTRSNAFETVYRRVNPHDWDGDGLANEIDANPYESDGDFFGTGVDWLNVNCAGVLSAATNGQGEVEISWHTNANPNAYYWLDLTATGALGVAKITATCDGESNLGDLAVVARTNEVCRVPLLVGATYTVESDLPISYSAVSSEHASIFTNSMNSLIVSFPLEFHLERVQMRDGGSDGYFPCSSPIDVGPRILDVSGGCCSCTTNEPGLLWDCSSDCGCGYYWHGLELTWAWEGYCRRFGWHGWCPCLWHADDGQATTRPRLVLDMPHTLFTNNNGGAEDSDIVRLVAGLFSPTITNGTLTLDLGLNSFVKVWTTSNRTEQVESAISWDVADTPCREFYVEGAEEIMRGVDGFTLKWRDLDGNLMMETNIDFAVYYPVVNVINNTLYDNGDLCNPVAIVTGTNACFALEFGAVHPPASEIKWSIVEGVADFVDGNDMGERVRVVSNTPGQRVTLRAQIDDCPSRPPEISAYVVDPLNVKLTVWIVGNNDGSYYATDAATVSNTVANVNKIYEQIGVSFYLDSICYTNKNVWLDIRKGRKGTCDLAKRRELVNISHDTDGLELYFVNFVARGVVANHDGYGIVATGQATARVIAHEIGHAFRCADVYHAKKHDAGVHIPDSIVCENHEPMDWSNGTGCRYYPVGVDQESIIKRLLMCGNAYPGSVDISAGSVYGFTEYDDDGQVDVGFFRSGVRRRVHYHR